MTPSPERPWCAQASRDRDEPLAATASRVERWLLVEHDTAWGPASVPTDRMPVETARALATTAAAAGARLLMVRRPGRTDPVGRMVMSVESRPGRESVTVRHVLDDDDLPWTAFGEGEPHDGPLYLVCTHGRHDRCCATRGRPVAAALAAAYGDAVWECSHLGGDRFAANVLVLPEGHYLGRVEPSSVVEAVRTLPAEHYRGRSSLPLPVQAAQAHVGGTPPLEAQEPLGRDRWSVRVGGRSVQVSYDRVGDQGEVLLTCDAALPKAVPVFRVS